MKRLKIILAALILSSAISAREYHVAKSGHDSNEGSRALPFLTMQAAADFARPGDVIIVHQGVYREHVNPPRGGSSDTSRIVYQSAKGERAEIRGSDRDLVILAGLRGRDQ